MAIYMLGGIVVLAVIYSFLAGPSVVRLVQQAQDKGDPEPILNVAKGLPPARRSYFFQQAIDILWRCYERELATKVIREFVTLHPNEKICQYWLKQALELEGGTARKVLGSEFVDNYYRPDVAATCGFASG